MKRYTLKQLKNALIRAHDRHGHEHNCSAARGSERDCVCGWLEVREMVKAIRPKQKDGK